MEDLCRLCAHFKSSRQLTFSIQDETSNIVQKLIACCRWESIGNNECENLPQKVCGECFTQLEKCWEFAERVADAQQQLLAKVIKVEPEMIFLSCPTMENDLQEEFKDDVKIPLDTFYVEELPVSAEEKSLETNVKTENLKPIMDEEQSEQLYNDSEVPSESASRATFYLCTTCCEIFSKRSSLYTHSKIHLKTQNKKHFEFPKKKNLIHHVPCHFGKKIEYECDVCHLKISRLDALKRHKMIHLGIQPYLCSTCGKGFRNKFNLKVTREIFF